MINRNTSDYVPVRYITTNPNQDTDPTTTESNDHINAYTTPADAKHNSNHNRITNPNSTTTKLNDNIITISTPDDANSKPKPDLDPTTTDRIDHNFGHPPPEDSNHNPKPYSNFQDSLSSARK